MMIILRQRTGTISKQKMDENNSSEEQTGDEKENSDDIVEGSDDYDDGSDDANAFHCIEDSSEQECNKPDEVEAVAENQAGIGAEENIADNEMCENDFYIDENPSCDSAIDVKGLKEDASVELTDNQTIHDFAKNKLKNQEDKDDQFSADCVNQKESICYDKSEDDEIRTSVNEDLLNQERYSDSFEDTENEAPMKLKKRFISDSARKIWKLRVKSDCFKHTFNEKEELKKLKKRVKMSDGCKDNEKKALQKLKKIMKSDGFKDYANEALMKLKKRLKSDSEDIEKALRNSKKRMKSDSCKVIEKVALGEKKSDYCLIVPVCFKIYSEPIVHQLPKEIFSIVSPEVCVNIHVYILGFIGPTYLPPNTSAEELPDLPPAHLSVTYMNHQDNENNYISLRDHHLEITIWEERLPTIVPETTIREERLPTIVPETTIREERLPTIVPLPSVHNTINQYEESSSQNIETSLKVNERILEGDIHSTVFLDRPESTGALTNNEVVNETQDIRDSDVEDDFVINQRNIPPGLSDTRARAQTFNHPLWPHRFLDSQTMAEAGLFYTGKKDHTMCFFCENVLDEWERGDIPLKEHIEKWPDCNFARLKQADEENRVDPYPGENGACGYSPELRRDISGHLQSALHVNPSRNGQTSHTEDERCRYARTIHHLGLQSIQRPQQDLQLRMDHIGSGNACKYIITRTLSF